MAILADLVTGAEVDDAGELALLASSLAISLLECVHKVCASNLIMEVNTEWFTVRLD